MRSLARESVFKYIFSRLFNPGDEGLFAVLNKDLSDSSKEFSKQLLAAVDKNFDNYLEKIQNLSVGYTLTRIRHADKCAIIIGMAELDNFVDTPIPVIIDQAVSLAAKYSTENSTDFVNGILAQYVKEKNNG